MRLVKCNVYREGTTGVEFEGSLVGFVAGGVNGSPWAVVADQDGWLRVTPAGSVRLKKKKPPTGSDATKNQSGATSDPR